MKIANNIRFGKDFGADNEYHIIASCEMTERGHRSDCRFGVCISVTDSGTWATHEFNAETYSFYSGHYFLRDEIGAWKDYYNRCQEVVKYIKRWDDFKNMEVQP